MSNRDVTKDNYLKLPEVFSMKRVLLSLSMLLCFISPALAATYYVDCGVLGNDSNNGTDPSTPWETVSKANTVAGGSTVYFNKGCTFTGKLNPPDNTITYGAYGIGAKPIIQGSGSDYALYINSRIGTVIQDLEFDNNNYSTARMDAAFQTTYQVTIQRCKFYVTGGSGAVDTFMSTLSGTNNMYDITYDSNEFINNSTGGTTAGLYFYHTTEYFYDIVISNNNFHDSYGPGIRFVSGSTPPITDYQPYGIDFKYNTFTNLTGSAIATYSGLNSPLGHQSYVRYNTLTNIGASNVAHVNAMQLQWGIGTIIEHNVITTVNTSIPDGDGIEVDWAWASETNISNNVIVRYNQLSGFRAGGVCAGVSIYAGSNTQVYYNTITNGNIGIINKRAHSTGNVFYNNTLSGNDYAGSSDDAGVGSPAPASTWINNIFANSAVADFRVANSSASPTESYNVFYGSPHRFLVNGVTSETISSTDQTGNPNFTSSTDFHVTQGSSASGNGTPVAALIGLPDLAGVITPCGTPANPNIGAYITDGNCTVTLSADLSLQIPMINLGGTYLWGDLLCESAVDGNLMCRVTDYGAANPSFSSCQDAALTTDMNVHIPTVIYDNSSYQADFVYVPTTDGQMWFKLVGAAKD